VSLVRSLRSSWRASLPFLLGAVGILAALGATWLNLALPESQDTASNPSPEEATQPAQLAALALPAFHPLVKGDVLSRYSEMDTVIPNRPRVDVLRYTVQTGDSVFAIAKMFGVKPETILWGSYDVLKDDPHSLRPGQELNVLPVDGTYHQWKEGDTIQSVADFYGVDAQEILDWPGNNLDPASPTIEPGTWLVIPGGRRAMQQWLAPTIARGSAGVGTAFGPGGCSGTYSGAVGTGGFMWPTSSHRISGNDYWSGHLAIDIAAGLGSQIVAADSGVVVFAGWANGGYGNMIMIDHGNGWQTLYAHLSQVKVGCGQSVAKGQVIGLAGSTGNSTGPHLHFETRFQGGFVNPWYVLP
jgi:murein DD-endopeptidase MepM/ murein hydrolase activator NlpD